MVFNSQTFSLCIAPVGVQHCLCHALCTELHSTSNAVPELAPDATLNFTKQKKKPAFPWGPIVQEGFKKVL